jgi:IS5 family transposase
MTRTPILQEPLGSLRSEGQHRASTFLDDVDRLVHWENFRPRLAAQYSTGGRPAHDPVQMLKLVFVQRLYTLSDEEVVRQLDDRRSFERFVGLERLDSSSLTHFRQRLVRADQLLDVLLHEINQQIASHGYRMETGSIVDASLVPSRHRPDARYATGSHAGEVIDPDVTRVAREHTGRDGQKHTTLHDGMKLHLRCSTDGMIQTARVTPNTVHDTNLLPELMASGPPCDMLYADRGYDSEANRNVLYRTKTRDGIMRRVPRTKRHQRRSIHARNRRLARRRGRIEGIFGVLKRTTTARLRYRGAKTNHLQATIDCIIYNLKRFVKWKFGRSPAVYLA